MKKIVFVVFLAFLCACMFSACSRELSSCADVLGAVIAAEVGLPSGDIYLSRAAEGEENYTQPSLLCALYGSGSTPPQSEGWIEFAIFLSSAAHPCELAVFLCDSPEAVRDTSLMLCGRLDLLKKTWGGGEYSSYVEGARVSVKGNFCILVVSSDPKSAEKAAFSVIN